jgi:hypothetical protein
VKTLVNSLAAAVRRFPWLVILVTIVISLVLGGLGGQFQPSEDQNESFAPDAPELIAQETISEQFGAETNQRVMQVVVSSETGDVITLDGVDATRRVTESILGGALQTYLVTDEETPPVVSYLSPVEQAIAQGAPAPATDAEVKQLYGLAVSEMPAEQAGLVQGLLPETADREAMTSPSGLMLSFSIGSFDDQAFVDASGVAAEQITATPLPDGITAEPFSFELLFSGEDEFQAEIGRLFASAGLIILLVLATVFLVFPRKTGNKVIAITGVIAMLGAIALLVVPSLARSFPDTLPEAMGDWDTGPLLLGAVAVFALVFVVWAFTSGRLRRTVADTLVTMIGIVFAIGIMNGVGYLVYGEAGPMTQILPILLIGLGVDYSIHITTRYREEAADGEPVADAVTVSIRTVGVALVLATITTAVGFLTNLFSDIPALREFGLLAAVGITASFFIMMTFVPAVRLLLDRRAEARGALDRASLRGGDSRFLPRMIGKTAWLAQHAAIPTLIVTLVLAVLGVFGTSRLEAKFSFVDFIPTTSPLRSTLQELNDDYGGGFGETTQVLVEGNVATPEAYNAMVGTTMNLAGTSNVIVFGDFPSAESPVSLVLQKANPTSPEFDQAISQAAGVAGMTSTSFTVSPDADVPALYDTLFAAAPIEAAGVLHENGGGYDSAVFIIQTQAGEDGAAQLSTDLEAAFAPVTDAGLTVVATSDSIVSNVIVGTLRDSQVTSLLYTLLAVLILLVINFWFEVRRPMLGVITTLPVVLVVVLAFGIMWGVGIPFGPITATVAALAVGIGIPYMIHVTHRYEEDRVRRDNENTAIESTLTHTGGALAGSALTTIFGFGILVTSSTIPFRQFGLVTAYTILLSLLAAILVLPSMLVLWDRWHRRHGDQAVEPALVDKAFGEDMDPA